jgi:hypothetical protein
MASEVIPPIHWKERIGLVAIGHTFKKAEEVLFDFTLYPAMIAWLGAVTGGLVMTAISALICWLYILFYDWAGKDWFGFELLKEARDGEAMRGRIGSFVQRVARQGDWVAFLALSLYTDPFMTAVYMRRGADAYNGLSRRDWTIFWGSVLVANLWWTILMTFAVAAARYFLNNDYLYANVV